MDYDCAREVIQRTGPLNLSARTLLEQIHGYHDSMNSSELSSVDSVISKTMMEFGRWPLKITPIRPHIQT